MLVMLNYKSRKSPTFNLHIVAGNAIGTREFLNSTNTLSQILLNWFWRFPWNFFRFVRYKLLPYNKRGINPKHTSHKSYNEKKIQNMTAIKESHSMQCWKKFENLTSYCGIYNIYSAYLFIFFLLLFFSYMICNSQFVLFEAYRGFYYYLFIPWLPISISFQNIPFQNICAHIYLYFK